MSQKRRKRRKSKEDKLLIFREKEARVFPLPKPKKPGDVGFDLTATADTVVPPGAAIPPTDIPTGLRIKLPKGTFAEIKPRSGAYINFPSLFICSAPIDGGYTGPLTPRFKNLGAEPVIVRRGERIAQLVIFGAKVPEVEEISELPKTERGESRYGSTGRK